MERVDLLITNASEVVTCRAGPRGAVGKDLDQLNVIGGGAVAVHGGRISDVDSTSALMKRYTANTVVDARGCLVSPGLIDAHSHLVHAGSRAHEYEQRLTLAPGESEQSLAGGILTTVRATRVAAFEELRAHALGDLDALLAEGTTTLEAKSGYGLDRETELKQLQVLSSINHAVDVVPTYLALHVLPPEFAHRRGDYLDLVLNTMADARNLAEYCDVACDPSCFTREECRLVAHAALDVGFRMRVHADQTGWAGGAELAGALGASSADHLDYVSEDGIAALVRGATVAVLGPGVSFHGLEMTPCATPWQNRPTPADQVRRMKDAGVTLATATDYNPGTCPMLSMQGAMRLAARLYRLSYAAVWQMATINAAVALDRSGDRGSIEVGKRADIVIWRVASHEDVIYRFASNLVDRVIKDGQMVFCENPE